MQRSCRFLKVDFDCYFQNLLEQRLIACGSLFPEIESMYRWKGKIEEGKEIKAVLKTQGCRFEAICMYIVENGSYEIPEIAQVDVVKGNPLYLSWALEATLP
ncbi:MAG: hypothetical protein A3E80_03065 [Chlamydiae bacterium RIFCSPHIGHO2_12_FULL_49_9]|nr:MAG: hypothetical protein A3E80_03065 [Chlamydiae bacterium RIFCSPHIGHO2_12_FULL_49_9]